jgi:hypothetical protein
MSHHCHGHIIAISTDTATTTKTAVTTAVTTEHNNTQLETPEIQSLELNENLNTITR